MKYKWLNIHRQHYETELLHDDSLIHGINYIEQMNEMASIKEIDGISMIEKKIYDGGSFSIFDFYYIIILSDYIICYYFCYKLVDY